MSEEKDLALMRVLTNAEVNVIRAQVVDLRAEKDNRSAEEIAADLRSIYPQLDAKVIKMIESSPGYVGQVVKSQSGKVAAAIPEIIEKMITNAKNGNIKHIDKLLQIMGVIGATTPGVQNNTQNNLNVKVMNNDELVGRFLGQARALDSDTGDIIEP